MAYSLFDGSPGVIAAELLVGRLLLHGIEALRRIPAPGGRRQLKQIPKVAGFLHTGTPSYFGCILCIFSDAVFWRIPDALSHRAGVVISLNCDSHGDLFCAGVQTRQSRGAS